MANLYMLATVLLTVYFRSLYRKVHSARHSIFPSPKPGFFYAKTELCLDCSNSVGFMPVASLKTREK
jgi:hypothetical protein